MPILIFKTGKGYSEEAADLRAFWDASYKRLHREPTTAYDLGRGFLDMRMSEKKGLYLLEVVPRFPRLWWVPLGILILLVTLRVTAVAPYLVSGFFFLSLFSFWTKYPYLFGFKMGFFRAHKYFPELDQVSKEDAIRWLVWGK